MAAQEREVVMEEQDSVPELELDQEQAGDYRCTPCYTSCHQPM